MNYTKILLFMTALVCLTFQACAQSDPLGEGTSSTMGSRGDYLSPNMGQMYPHDWLEGGYVRSSDRSMTMDPGLSGMLQWLNAPVPNYPWYTTGGSYYRQTYRPTVTPIASMPMQTPTVGGDTPVTIQSQGMRGYQVFLDENYIGTEGTAGDVLDGVFNFKVAGGQNHDIRVYDGQFNYPRSMYFARGVLKIINVEPGTAVYI